MRTFEYDSSVAPIVATDTARLPRRRANIASKRVPAATAPAAPKHKAKKRRKGGFQALPLLARR